MAWIGPRKTNEEDGNTGSAVNRGRFLNLDRIDLIKPWYIKTAKGQPRPMYIGMIPSTFLRFKLDAVTLRGIITVWKGTTILKTKRKYNAQLNLFRVLTKMYAAIELTKIIPAVLRAVMTKVLPTTTGKLISFQA